ncbi:restriction endonuclease subunit S [Elizabethkingia anophelis]|nr:restriction endonuclease subunit S [Elizabethkingia anophelis]
MNKTENKLVPELRFPEFVNDGEWKEDKFENLISTVTPPKKLSSSNYLPQGKFPIIDQSQNYYCGRTDDKNSIIFDGLPLIIFGDHTCIFKVATEPFAQGADGIKIIKTKSIINSIFLYQYLQYNSVRQEEYKRHFSILKNKIVHFPNNKTNEQQKIADCLSSLDEVITAHNDKLETLKNHKKGLLQNLFPQEGETVPKYRFPEFKNDGNWKEKKLGKVFSSFSGGTPSTSEKDYYGGKIPFIRSAEINKKNTELFLTELGLKNSSAKLVNKGDLLIALYGANSGDAGISQIDGAINQAILCLKSDYSNNFVYQVLSLKKDWIINKYLQGGQGNLSGDIIKSIELYFPEKLEQQKIADCLSEVDNLITAQADKIEQLKAHKKGLMQRLFPQLKA